LAVPEADRFDFAALPTAPAAVARELAGSPLFLRLDQAAKDSYSAMIAKWLLMQVRSIPIGMRIDQILFRDEPTLRDQLVAGLVSQNQENYAAYSRSLGHVTLPDRCYGPMAAYALFSDRLIGRAQFGIPFEASGLSEIGRELLRDFDSIDSGAAHDRRLVDTWAERMMIRDLYEWIPYRK